MAEPAYDRPLRRQAPVGATGESRLAGERRAGEETGYDLTPRARQLLAFLSGQAACPSVDEMRRALGLASKSGVVRLLTQLEGRGYVRRQPGRERAIELLRPIAPHEARSVGVAIAMPLVFLAGIAIGAVLVALLGAAALAAIGGALLLAAGTRHGLRRRRAPRNGG